MYKVGVVGPLPSVERIVGVAKEFAEEIQFIPYPYNDARETENIVFSHKNEVMIWLFSGQVPYLIAKKTLGSDENLQFIPHTGSSLYKCFLHMAYYQQKLLERVSVDMVQSEDVEEALAELGIPTSEIYVKKYDDYTEYQELLNFHLDLWKAGKTEAAFTCYQATFLTLQEKGIPSYWISPTRMVIRQNLVLIAEKFKTSYFKDMQIGLGIIEIEDFDKVIDRAKTPYHLQYLELKVKESLLKLCERVDGSLLEKGNGRYAIFSTRGAMERELQGFTATARLLSLDVEGRVAVGIGYGQTVFAAENHGRRAVQYAKERNDYDIVIVQENGVIQDSTSGHVPFSYSSRSDDQNLLEALKKANVSIKTYNKMEALAEKMNWTEFTSADIAASLSMTERNARRIISGLCEQGLMECVGEEMLAARGRPTKRYAFS
ncbi:hypothetical protein [Brevibacillus daliensis]|uniref:hypothetical protein n=1 Tax=Brevibacillus daliensis TaxID=2892995 RepID=UPI001E3486B0|nr:hypothetical protein [Brevibacillus daliensis]